MAKTPKSRPSFDSTPVTAPVPAAGSWAYRSDMQPPPVPAQAPTAADPGTEAPVQRASPAPGWAVAVAAPLAIAALIVLAPLAWLSPRQRR